MPFFITLFPTQIIPIFRNEKSNTHIIYHSGCFSILLYLYAIYLMTYVDIRNNFAFLEKDFGYDLEDLVRHDNKSEFELRYSNRNANRSIIVLSYSKNLDVFVSKLGNDIKVVRKLIKNMANNKFKIADNVLEITKGRVKEGDLRIQYSPELFIKDYIKQYERIAEIYQDILRYDLKKVISGQEWINWK